MSSSVSQDTEEAFHRADTNKPDPTAGVMSSQGAPVATYKVEHRPPASSESHAPPSTATLVLQKQDTKYASKIMESSTEIEKNSNITAAPVTSNKTQLRPASSAKLLWQKQYAAFRAMKHASKIKENSTAIVKDDSNVTAALFSKAKQLIATKFAARLPES